MCKTAFLKDMQSDWDHRSSLQGLSDIFKCQARKKTMTKLGKMEDKVIE